MQWLPLGWDTGFIALVRWLVAWLVWLVDWLAGWLGAGWMEIRFFERVYYAWTPLAMNIIFPVHRPDDEDENDSICWIMKLKWRLWQSSGIQFGWFTMRFCTTVLVMSIGTDAPHTSIHCFGHIPVDDRDRQPADIAYWIVIDEMQSNRPHSRDVCDSLCCDSCRTQSWRMTTIEYLFFVFITFQR